MAEHDAYFAGLFDGEGCVYMGHNNCGSPQVYFEIKMTCERTVSAFHRYCNCGTMSNVKPGKAHYKPLYKVKLQGKRGVLVLSRMLPYMITKRADVMACIKEYEARPYVRRGRPPKATA